MPDRFLGASAALLMLGMASFMVHAALYPIIPFLMSVRIAFGFFTLAGISIAVSIFLRWGK